MLVEKWRFATLVLAWVVCSFHPSHAFFGITIRREDEGAPCYIEGVRHQCTFFLVCALNGGTWVSNCPGSYLTACCSTPHPAGELRRSPTKIIPPPGGHHLLPMPIETNPQAKDKAICGKRIFKPTSRIVGGNEAEFAEFPWQAHIRVGLQQCGGVLISRFYILTAAHCVYRYPLQEVSIVLGAYDVMDPRYQILPIQRFRALEKVLHPEFRFSPSHPDRFDIALLRLDRPARYQDNTLPVCLPPKGWNFQGWNAIITGWGKTDSIITNRHGTRILQKVEVPIISSQECEAWHHYKGINVRIYPEMICAGYESGRKDACVGDSGGPLVVNLDGRWTLVGIISAGFGCAQWRQPGIYHSISSTVDWISNHIRE